MSITHIGGTFLAVITASLLKTLLSANQSLQLPSLASYDHYSNVLPFEDSDKESDAVTNLFLTLRFPQSLPNNMDPDFDMKRQFDPWGGKRHSKPLAKDEDISRKRQFSPWGGKRSFRGNYHPRNSDLIDADIQLDDLVVSRNKRGFNSWGGKRDLNSWIDTGNSKVKDLKRGFNSWGGKRDFNSWGGKRNFNAWGGKRSENVPTVNFHDSVFEPKKNTNVDNKRQSFNAWGGKRSFNSWGGKKSFNSWGGKRIFHSLNGKHVTDFDPQLKEVNILDDNSSPYTYNASIEEKEKNMH